MKLKVKIITGFRRDQEYSIDADEAHKAYHLFLNPEARTVFSSGLAIIGNQIKEIVPDYQGTMGWNPTHVLDSNDWNELRTNGVANQLRDMLFGAKQIAQYGTADELQKPLSQLLAGNTQISDRTGSSFAQQVLEK